MKTRILGIAFAAAAALVVAASAANAKRDGLYYEYTYYSDSDYTVAVGGYRQYCYNNNTIVTGPSYGEQTPYETATPIGQCPGLGDW